MSGEGREERPGRRHDLWDDDEPTEQGSAATDAAPSDASAGSRRSRHGRHERPGRRWPWWVIAVAALLVVLLCAGGAVFALRGGGEDSACSGGTISVAAAPEIAEPLEQALGKVEKEEDCAEFEVDTVSASSVTKSINEDKAPDVWVPDSSTWTDALDDGAGNWTKGTSIATSPIALAVGSERQDAASSISSWGTLLRDKGSLQMANPDVDTASRLAFHASRIGEPDRIGLETGKRLIAMSRFAAPSSNKLLDDYSKQPKKTKPFPLSEQQIATHNEEHEDVPPLRAVIPKKGTLMLDYPWMISPELSGEARDVAERARTELGSVEVREALTKAGFRGPDGEGGPTIAGEKAGTFTRLEPLSPGERVEAVEQWDTLRTDMRMLAVIDASGSMSWDSTTPGMTRWEVTKGSLLKGVNILPAGSEVGAWVFSSNRKGQQDYEQIAPIKRLDADTGSGTYRDELRKTVKEGDKYLGGDTGLYDSVWAAYQKMSKEYDPDHVNSVVVFTDGKNDDPNGGLSLDQLLTKLDGAYNSKKPVRVITIGMGEADPTALQKIADETGGTSYIAETPDDIERVFVQALLARN